MNRPFSNNLREGDRVWHTTTERFGIVYTTPRDDRQRNTSVTLEGTNTARYLDVMELRLDPDKNGKFEDVAPVDGEPPAESPPKRSDAPEDDAVALLKRQKGILEREIAGMNDRARELRAKIERLDRGINALEGRA